MRATASAAMAGAHFWASVNLRRTCAQQATSVTLPGAKMPS